MADDEEWVPREYTLRPGISTRPVRIAGKGHPVGFTEEAMRGVIDQVHRYFLPLSYEHLAFIPPWGRVYEAEIVEADDGERDVVMMARDLPQYVGPGPESDLDRLLAGLPESEPVSLDLSVGFERRNYSDVALSKIEEDAPLPLDEHLKWSVLPPIEFILVAAVTWGAVKFAGAFCAELGRAAAQGLISWFKRAGDASLEPERDRIHCVSFELGDRRTVDAYILVKHDDDHGEEMMANGFESISAVASFAGLQKESDYLPGLVKAAFIFDGQAWRLGWWTDGTRVNRTQWFESNCPDSSRFLGHGFLGIDLPVEGDDGG